MLLLAAQFCLSSNAVVDCQGNQQYLCEGECSVATQENVKKESSQVATNGSAGNEGASGDTKIQGTAPRI